MKLRSILLLGAILFCLPLQTFAQKSTLSKANLAKTFSFYKNPNPSLNHENYFEAMAAEMHLSPASKMVLTQETTDRNGTRHFRYQQFHHGVPIFGSRYILHEKEGKVVCANGHYTPDFSAVTQPGIDPRTATAFAKLVMKAKVYGKNEAEPVLCFIDPAFPKTSESLVLAYQIDLSSTDPFDKRRYFVDATSGEIVRELPLLLEEGVPSTAKTRYYGIQNIITDSVAPQEFVLRDLTRGGGIFIKNNDGSNFTNPSSTWDLTNGDKDEVALDAHYCTQEYYDMMLADFNWQGQDGNGKALNVVVHIGDFANAFWDGESTQFADGDCTYGPLTTLEVVGHEFTHGMIDYTSKLAYEMESGAINESLADMFGKMLERKTDPANFSWSLGHSFLLSPDAAPFRIMDNPNELQMPALYKGQYWEDFNDVHTNSSIGNLWFSMIVDGKQGTNEIGVNFDVPALGMDKAGQIIFEVNRNYFIENSDYNDFYLYSIEAATDLFGAGSTEVQAVTEAWKAVGLPNEPNGAFDLSIVGTGFASANYCDIGAYLPVSIKIVNSSSIAYDPAMMATVGLSNSNVLPFEFELTSPIGPGEVFEIQANNWIQITQPGYIFVDGFLFVTDDNPDNNSTYSIYNILAYPSNDLGLSVNQDERDCFATTRTINVFVSNYSCEPVPAGTILNFTATDDLGNLVWASDPFPLQQDLQGGSAVFNNYVIPVGNSPLTYNLIYPSDPDLQNNTYLDPFEVAYLTITDDYINKFEANDGQDGYLALEGLQDLTMFYQNSRFFASSGYTQDPAEFQRCADPLEVFNQEYASGLNASIHACVDFSQSPAPTLEFDLAQFRNITTDTSNFEYSSMLQAKWTGNGNGELVVFGQPEGQVKHHTIALPANFKGALDFKLYTELGQWGLDPSLLNHDDFVLLDNLKLSAPTSGTEEADNSAVILIAPNPALDKTSIQASVGIKTILLHNVNGQTLHAQYVNAYQTELDLKGLANGFYFLNIQLENGKTEVRKLVKMN